MCALLRLRVWRTGERGGGKIGDKLLIRGGMEDFRDLLPGERREGGKEITKRTVAWVRFFKVGFGALRDGQIALAGFDFSQEPDGQEAHQGDGGEQDEI